MKKSYFYSDENENEALFNVNYIYNPPSQTDTRFHIKIKNFAYRVIMYWDSFTDNPDVQIRSILLSRK